MSTPAVEAALEPLVSTLARKFRVEVDTATVAPGATEAPDPVWTQVRGLTGVKPTMDNTTEDDSDFDSGDWGSDVKTQIKWGLELDMARKRGVYTKNYDPGQELLRGLGEETGPEATVHVRWYDRDGGPEAYEGYATVQWEDGDGGPTDLSSASATLAGQGRRNRIENPAAA
jgi:hypothetical protein